MATPANANANANANAAPSLTGTIAPEADTTTQAGPATQTGAGAGTGATAQADEAAPAQQAEADGAPTEAQPGPALEAQTAQGGGADGPPVTGGGGARRPPKRGTTVITDTHGDVHKLVLWGSDGRKFVCKKPDPGTAEWHQWNWMSTQYRKAKRFRGDSAALTEVQAVVAQHRSKAKRRDGAAANAPHKVPLSFDMPATPLSAASLASIENRYYLRLVEDTCTPNGQLFVPGPNGRGSRMGKFPHMVMRPQRSSGVPTHYCGADRLLALRVELVERKEGGEVVPGNAQDLLKIVRSQFEQSEKAKHNFYEKELVVHMSIEFAEGPRIGHPITSDAFHHPLLGGSAFLPAESVPYRGGSSEKEIEFGHATYRNIRMNNISRSNLIPSLQPHRYRLAVHTLNPWLNDVEGFTVYSSPFFVKSKLHNDAKSNEYYVAGPDGAPTPFVPLQPPAKK